MASPLSQVRGRPWHDDEEAIVHNIRIGEIYGSNDGAGLDDDEDSEESPSQHEKEEEELHLSSFSSSHSSSRHSIPFSRNEGWLEEATETLLDVDAYPVGELTEEDLVAIGGIMAAWSRRASGPPPSPQQHRSASGNGPSTGTGPNSSPTSRLQAAMSVELLLKRVVDDVRAGNPAVRVSTRLYTYVRASGWLVLTNPFGSCFVGTRTLTITITTHSNLSLWDRPWRPGRGAGPGVGPSGRSRSTTTW
jgi:hypothetical protein